MIVLKSVSRIVEKLCAFFYFFWKNTQTIAIKSAVTIYDMTKRQVDENNEKLHQYKNKWR